MDKIAATFLGLMVAVNSFAGPRAEIAAGSCHYSPHGEGAWWQGSDFSTGQKTANCGQVGVANLISETVGWRVAYAHLGRYQLHEDAWGAGTGPEPHWSALGYGEVQGVSLGLFKEWPIGRFSASLEGGVFAYDSHWHATAYHWASEVNRTIETPHRYGIAPYLGAQLAYVLTPRVALTLGARRYVHINSNQRDSNPDSGDQIGWKSASVVSTTLGLAVRF